MSNLIVITFDDPGEAGQVREALRDGRQVSLDDSAVAVKDAVSSLVKLDGRRDSTWSRRVSPVGERSFLLTRTYSVTALCPRTLLRTSASTRSLERSFRQENTRWSARGDP